MFKILDPMCTPTKGSKSAGIDLYAREDVVIDAGETVKVPLGVCIDLTSDFNDMTHAKCFLERATGITVSTPDHIVHERIFKFKSSHYLELHPRSSLRAKGLIAGVEILNLDYPDEIMIIVHNLINRVFIEPIEINKGDKVAQILLKEHKGYLLGDWEVKNV